MKELMMNTMNGNGSATTAAPPVVTGASLVHRHLDKRQKAVLAANVVDGLARFVPTNRQIADIFGVSVAYIDVARRLSPSKRNAILGGRDSTSFVSLLNGRRQPVLLVPRSVSNGREQVDPVLIDMIRAVGVERILDAAVVVEHTPSLT
jgi:hypothetical protein